MGDIDEDAPQYSVERSNDDPESWRVVGPNGLVGVYRTAREAQAKADFLNEQVVAEREDDS